MSFLRLYDTIISKSHFPKISSFESELKKVALLRIILGSIVLIRFSEIAYSYFILDPTSTLTFAAFTAVGLISLFTIGFLTPVVTSLLLFLIIKFDFLLNAYTLATGIFVITLIPLFLVNSGQYYSFDKYLTRFKIFKSAISLPYQFIGAKNSQDINRAYFLTFFLYFIISLGAITLHLKDDSWMSGLTTKSLLLNSYLNTYFTFFRQLDSSFPGLLSFLSISAAIFQSIFQLFAIPLIFTRIGKFFVFVWGLIFFTISLFFINLSYLPHVEILLWLLIFIPIDSQKQRVQIFYDDYCNLCKKAMLFFKYINYNDRLVFIPISKNAEKLKPYELSEKTIKAYMSGLYKEKVYIGYDLYIQIIKSNPLLWILLPVFFLGKITKIGPLVYNYIAENRFKIFEQCELSFEDEIAKKIPIIQLRKFNFLQNGFYLLYGVLLILFLGYKFPLTNSVIPKPEKFSSKVHELLVATGLDIPNVFNKVDLTIGNLWMEIYSFKNNELTLLPITGQQGERLNYLGYNYLLFSNHNSDLMYYGTTLKFRRGMIGANIVEEMKENGFGWSNLRKRLIYDYRYNTYTGSHDYLVKVYQNSGSTVSYEKTNPSNFDRILKYEQWFSFNGQELVNIESSQ